MEIWEIDKIIVFIAFFVPGFISIKVYQLLVPANYKAATEQVVDAVAYSSINYAFLILPIIYVEKLEIEERSIILYCIFYFCVLFVFPVIWAFLWKKLRTFEFVQDRIPHPTEKPWDYFFSKRECYWVKITLKNGTIIGGLYAENSFASSAPAEEQIYLEETWLLNERGGFERKKCNTAGVMVLSSEISHIEFREFGDKK